MMILVIGMLVLTSGCAQVFSDVTVNPDLTGTWKSKIFVPDPTMLPKAELEKSLKQNGIQNYKIEPTKGEIVINGQGDKGQADGWEVTAEWKNETELKKIVALLAGAATPNQNQKQVQ